MCLCTVARAPVCMVCLFPWHRLTVLVCLQICNVVVGNGDLYNKYQEEKQWIITGVELMDETPQDFAVAWPQLTD